jgi:thioesterase domain-containing protein
VSNTEKPELSEVYKKDLLESIPVVKGMELDITLIEPERLSVKAPLNTNINYEGTAFGGSLNTCCVLASYLLVHHILRMGQVEFDSIVIQNSEVNYLSPVTADFEATAIANTSDISSFKRSLERRGVGRLGLKASVKTCAGEVEHVVFNARFVAAKS